MERKRFNSSAEKKLGGVIGIMEDEHEEYEAQDEENSLIYEEPVNKAAKNPLGEEIRLSAVAINQLKSSDPRLSSGQTNIEGSPGQQNSISRSRPKNPNIFGRARSGSKSRETVALEDPIMKKTKYERQEHDFEKKCLRIIKVGDWTNLEAIASEHLEDMKCESFKGFFYLGVSFYKTGEHDNAIRAFQKAEAINSEDAQLQYNLGLANFKLEQYNQAVDHLKKCTKLDPQHPFAYNNLAFLYNMHQFYSETIQVCGCAKMNNPQNHNCHRHWAFALFKKGEMGKAIKKVKKGIQKNPKEPDNWIIWGLILRTVGNYKSAQHKFKKALKIDKDNETAK